MKKTLILTFFFFLLGSGTQAKILCLHPQVCNIINALVEDKKLISPILLKVGDPHHFSPGPKAVKMILKGPLVISPPKGLFPWIKQFTKKRKEGKTLVLKLPSSIFNTYPHSSNRHNLSHFWLYPELICQFQKDISQFLNMHRIPQRAHLPCSSREIIKKIANISIQKSSRDILLLTHDALAPLFNRFLIPNLPLKSSKHSSKITPLTLKRVIREKERKKGLILIKEKNLQYLSDLKPVEKITSKIVSIDSRGNYPSSPFFVLEHIVDVLKKLGPLR